MITVLLAITVPLFSGGQGEADEVTTVRFLNFSASGGNEDHLGEIRDAFESENPDVEVEVETIGYEDYFTQLQTRIAGGQAPDAFELNFENFAAYGNRGLLRDLDDDLTATDVNLDDLNSQALDAFSLDGTQYGLPASFSTVMLFYNQDLFDEAGLDYPTDDWTWTEAHEAAEAIRDLGEDTFGLFQPIQFHEFYKVVQQYGGGLISDDGSEFTVDRPENVTALETMVGRIQDSNIMPSERQLSGMGDWDLFLSGRLGMLVTGIWAFPHFTDNAEFDWDVVVEPAADRRATHFFANGLSVHADSNVAEAAVRWIAYLSASETAGQVRLDAGWELPASNHSDLVAAYAEQTPPDNREAVFTSLDYLVTPPIVTDFSRMADIVTSHLESASQGDTAPGDALQNAQRQLESEIDL
ncbi:MAG: sugar ABC transporter substrate-binding protein [Spirochaetia bacterium]